jgi:hypothetical protein
MTNGNRDIVTEGILRVRDMLLAHHAMGRDLEEVVAYLERTIRRRQREEENQQ